MQQIIVEKPYKFVPPYRSALFSRMLFAFGIPQFYIRRFEAITSFEVRGMDRFEKSLSAGHAILLTPNHSRTADPPVMGLFSHQAGCQIYGMASWHLFQKRLDRTLLRMLGAFSVNREGVDRGAVNLAIEILEKAERPLIIFPEGATTRTNDKLGPLLDGVPFIARAAAKKRAKHTPGGKLVVHPVAIKYLYQGDIEQACDETLRRVEHRLSWHPQSDMPLVPRILKVGSALLALKEIEFFGEPQSGGFSERIDRLIDRLLRPHEITWLGKACEGHTVPRVKALRTKLLPDMVEGRVDAADRERRWRVLADVYLAQQIAAYPGDYLAGRASIDRMLEICEKFEEDLTDKAHPHSPTKAVIQVDEAIEVSPERDRKALVDPLLVQIENRLQTMLNTLALESPEYTK